MEGRGRSRRPARARSQAGEGTPLIAEPTLDDVLLGRGRGIQQHAGNQRFQALVDQNQQRYFDATSRHEKIHIAHQVVVAISQSGRFLKYDDRNEGWVVVPEATARQKVCQALQYRRRQVGALSEAQQAETAPTNAVASVAAAAVVPLNNPLNGFALDPFAQLLYPHVAAAAASIPHASNGNSESKQSETDSDYASLIRALSQGAHNRNNNRPF